MPNPQTERKLTARISGYSGPVHEYSGGKEKRLAGSIDVPRGDGSNIVDKLDDPMITYEALVLKIIVEKNDAFIGQLRALHKQHRDNPNSAGPVLIQSRESDGSVVDVLSFTRATIQEIDIPTGNTQGHSAAMATITLMPRDAVA